MCRLFDQYHLENIFEPGFPGLMEAFYVQERLIELLLPDVHKAFVGHSLSTGYATLSLTLCARVDQNEHYISTSAYATKWYITLFSNSVPFATQVRLWDGLLLEGLDFLIVTALAIIWQFQGKLCSQASLSSFQPGLTPHTFTRRLHITICVVRIDPLDLVVVL